MIERKGEAGFPIPHIRFVDPIGLRKHQVTDAEMEFTRMDFGSMRVGEDRLEPHAKFANAGGVVTLGAGADAGDGLDIPKIKKSLTIMLEFDCITGQRKTHY